MFDVERAIREWRNEVRVRGINATAIMDELESHLRDELEQQTRSGLEVEQAFEFARANMGQTGALKTEFAKIRTSEMLLRLKQALLTLLGVPNYYLMTNMNTSSSSSNIEAGWATYVKATTFLAPSLILWVFSCVFMMPKLKQICGNAGFSLPTVLQATLFATSHPVLISIAILGSLILLEWRSNKWPRFRRATLGAGVFLINSLVLALITMMVYSALVAAPAMAQHVR